MNLLEKVLDLIFLPKCGVCEKLGNDYLCDSCYQKLKKIAIGKKKIVEDKSYTEFMYLFDYQGIIQEKILQYKFHDKSYLDKMFGKLFVNYEKSCDFLKSYDIIIPVPIHTKRKTKRGYNQCELIAKYISKQLDMVMYTDVLVKKKDTISQSTLGRMERKSNVKDAYKVQNIVKIKQKKIVILDDVYTTGSTIEECSKVLKSAGVSKIGVITIAKD